MPKPLTTEGCVLLNLGGCGLHTQVLDQQGVMEKIQQMYRQRRKCRSH